MTRNGGLDFEANFESLFTSLVESAVHSRVEFFQSLLDKHQLSTKKEFEELFGANIPLLRLIANRQIFKPHFLHPMDTLERTMSQHSVWTC